MTGSVAGPTPSITRWVQNLERMGEKDRSQIRGTEKRLHIRTGFEKFSEGLQKLFNKKDPVSTDGMKTRVYEGIKKDYGERVADKIFAKFEHASTLTVGDLRSMANMAKMESQAAKSDPQISMKQVENITLARVLSDNYAPDPDVTTAYSGKNADTTIQVMSDVLDRFAGKMALRDDQVSMVTTMVNAQVRNDIMSLCDGGNHAVTSDDVVKIIDDRMSQTLEAIQNAGGEKMSARAMAVLISSEHGVTFDEQSFNAKALSQPRISSETPRDQLESLAIAFSRSNVGDIPTFLNNGMKIYEYTEKTSDKPATAQKQKADAEQAGLEIHKLVTKYQGTPFNATMQSFGSVAQIFDRLMGQMGEPSGLRNKTNREVLEETARTMAPQFGLLPQDGFSQQAIKGPQTSVRFTLHETGNLKVAIQKFIDETDSQKLGSRKEAIRNSAKELENIVNNSIADYSKLAKMAQDPAFLQNLSPSARAIVSEMGAEYAKLAVALADPGGPAQGFIAMANLAAIDPQAAANLYGMARTV